MIHLLKITECYFSDVELGLKTFEVRINDRNFQKGDTVLLCEFSFVNECYSGAIIYARIGDVYSLPDLNLLLPNVCVFSLFEVNRIK